MEVRDNQGRKVGTITGAGGGDGSCTLVLCGIGIVIGAIYLCGAFGMNLFTYHFLAYSHKDAVRGGVQAVVHGAMGGDAFVGLVETDGVISDSNLVDVTLAPDLGGFPGEAAVMSHDTDIEFYDFPLHHQWPGSPLWITVYIHPTVASRTSQARVSLTPAVNNTGRAITPREFLIVVPAGKDHGSTKFIPRKSDVGVYYVDVSGTSGMELEAVVISPQPPNS